MEKLHLQKRGISIYLDNDLIRKLSAHGKSNRLSISWLINKWVSEKLDEIEKKGNHVENNKRGVSNSYINLKQY